MSEGGSPVKFAHVNCMPLDSSLRGNDKSNFSLAIKNANNANHDEIQKHDVQSENDLKLSIV
jgi:hypothetical protein